MATFKMGDTVKVSKADDNAAGLVGIIDDMNGDHYRVRFSKWEAAWYWPEEIEAAESGVFCPNTGDLYSRPGNEGIWALVITPERPAYGGYLVYAVLMYPNGHLSAPQMVVLLPTDNHICKDFPLPVNGYLALRRRQQIREHDDAGKFPAAYGRYIAPARDLDDQYTPEQLAFVRSIAHKGMGQITDDERAVAATLRIVLSDFKPGGCKGWDAPLKLQLPGMPK